MKFLKNALIIIAIFVFCAIILAFSIRGIAGNPTAATINNANWTDNGPFELSPDRGRFALTYSLVEDGSFYFSLPIARFATPDLGYSNGHYVSLFAPLLSYVIIPGYLLGKVIGLAQVGTFAVIALFAIINTLLIRSIAIRLGAHKIAATIGGLVFLFASPAFTYAVTLYQHHISTFLILMSIYILLRFKNIWSLFFVWFLFVASLPMDNPNLFLMAPIVVYSLARMFQITTSEKKVHVSFKWLGILTFFGGVLPLVFFLWFNQMSYGSPFQLGGTVASVKAIDAFGKPQAPTGVDSKTADVYLNPQKQQKNAIQFFQTRYIINGFYEHLISPDRGMLYFTPILFFSLLGIFFFYRRNPGISAVLLGVVGMDILLYSMWGDPYGGWAFGSRYLIPAYAMLAIFIGLLLTKLRKNIPFLIIFFLILSYSVCVNTLGAITSSQNPPQAEALALEKISHRQEKYSFDRDIDILLSGHSKSFIWQTYFQDTITAVDYYRLLVIGILVPFFGLFVLLRLSRSQEVTEYE